MNKVNVLCWKWADFVRNGQGMEQLKQLPIEKKFKHFYSQPQYSIILIVFPLSISHKFKQILMQNVDFVHFSQIGIISDMHM